MQWNFQQYQVEFLKYLCRIFNKHSLSITLQNCCDALFRANKVKNVSSQ